MLINLLAVGVLLNISQHARGSHDAEVSWGGRHMETGAA
jgi:hypothetical protein